MLHEVDSRPRRPDPLLTRVLLVAMRALVGIPFGAYSGCYIARWIDGRYAHIGLIIGIIVGAIAGAGLWNRFFSRYDHPGGR